jgi:hypothetical protein
MRVGLLCNYRKYRIGLRQEQDFLLDTKPVPVIGYQRHKVHSDSLDSASYGACASRNLKYFDYKLVMLATLAGIPAVYDLVPANLDERHAAEGVLFHTCGCDIVGDKGFIDTDSQAQIEQYTANHLYTPKRANQFQQNPPGSDRWLDSVRERIEGTFHEIQNTGRNLERFLPRLSSTCAPA